MLRTIPVFHQELEGRRTHPKLIQKCPSLEGKIDPRDSSKYLGGLEILQDRCESQHGGRVDGKLGYVLYESAGLQPQEIETLAQSVGVPFDAKSMQEYFSSVKKRDKSVSAQEGGSYFSCEGHRLSSLDELSAKIPPTDDQYKYSYQRMAENRYGFLKLEAKIQGFVTWTDADTTEMKVTSESDFSVDAR